MTYAENQVLKLKMSGYNIVSYNYWAAVIDVNGKKCLYDLRKSAGNNRVRFKDSLAIILMKHWVETVEHSGFWDVRLYCKSDLDKDLSLITGDRRSFSIAIHHEYEKFGDPSTFDVMLLKFEDIGADSSTYYILGKNGTYKKLNNITKYEQLILIRPQKEYFIVRKYGDKNIIAKVDKNLNLEYIH